jgi:hypothetical protein
MRRFHHFAPVALFLAVLACADSDDVPMGAATDGDDAEGAMDTEDDADPSTTSTSTTSTSTTSTSAPDDDDGSDDGNDDDGSDDGEDETGEVCPAGTEACPCDDDACDGDLLCVQDACEAPISCPADINAPNDSEENAAYLGQINDCNWNGGTVEGVLSWGDEDWFHYTGTDAFGCWVDPAREIVADADLRICKFFECLNGIENTEFTCPPGTSSATSPAGRPGCCGSSGFKMGVYDCAGTSNDSAHVFIRIDQGAQQCVAYTFDYHY